MRLISFLVCLFYSLASYSQTTILFEDFNSGTLPIGWDTMALSGVHQWDFGIDASTAQGTTWIDNIDGTNLAFFNDDAAGINSTNNRAALMTPFFSVADSLKTYLELDYNYNDLDFIPNDSFIIELLYQNKWHTLFYADSADCGFWYRSRCQRTNYSHQKLDISQFHGSNVRIRFVYFDGNDWCYDVGIDNVHVYSVAEYDLAVNVISPETSCYTGFNDSIQIEIQNTGDSTVWNIPIGYRLDNNVYVRDTIPDSLAADSTLIIVYKDSLLKASGQRQIIAFVNYSLDTVQTNDTSIYSFNFFNGDTLPQIETFESSIVSWSSDGFNSSWERTSPSGTIIQNAYQGQFCMITEGGPSNLYNSNEHSFLESSCLDFTGIADPIIEFYMIHELELDKDSIKLEYSINGGVDWLALPRGGSAMNWNSPGKTYWTGTSAGWFKVVNELSLLAGIPGVRLRFALRTDSINQFEGVAIDSIRVYEPTMVTDIDEVNSLASTIDDFSIFPNPSSGEFAMMFSSRLIGYRYTVRDLSGKEILNGVLSTQKETLDLRNQSKGLYLFSIPEAQINEKLIVK